MAANCWLTSRQHQTSCKPRDPVTSLSRCLLMMKSTSRTPSTSLSLPWASRVPTGADVPLARLPGTTSRAKQLAESTKQRAAFEIYWRLGSERSMEWTREVLLYRYGRAPSIRMLYGWSSRFYWQHRLARLDEARAKGPRHHG